MRRRPPVDYKFQQKSKFALLTGNNVYTDLPDSAFQLSDGTWAMPGVPVPELGIWKEWIGSIRVERLGRANLVLFVEEPSDHPQIFDAVHQRLNKELSLLVPMLHLGTGIECADGADLLCGSSENGIPGIRQMSQMPTFYQSKGWQRVAHNQGMARRRPRSARGRRGDGRRHPPIQAGHPRPEYTVQRPEGNRAGSSPSVRPVVGGPRPPGYRQDRKAVCAPLPDLRPRGRRHAHLASGGLRDA